MKHLQKAADAFRDEARAAGLELARVDAVRAGEGSIGSALRHVVGRYTPDDVLAVTIAATDGTRWLYIQPFSHGIALPGAHHFQLRGAPASPLFAKGPGWFAREFKFRLILSVFCAITLIGIPIAFLLMAKFPGPAKLEGGPEAQAINATGAFKKRVFASRFGMQSFILPWVVQLYSVGGGESRLVCRAPRTSSSRVFRAPIADFAWAQSVARAAQRSLEGSDAYPESEPKFPTPYAALIESSSPDLNPPPSRGAALPTV